MSGALTHEEEQDLLTFDEKMRDRIAEEVGKAIEAAIPYLLNKVGENKEETLRHDQEARNVGYDEREIENIGGCSYWDFAACKPPTFIGVSDPLLSERCLSDMEGAFRTSHCAEKDKVIYASNLLRDRAKNWWKVFINQKGEERMS